MIQIEDMQATGRRLELRKVVIKLGTAVVAGEGDKIDEGVLRSVADGVGWMRERGVQVIVVSSGAVGMGRRQFPEFTPRTIPDRQAMAAVGQVGLMHAYKSLFNERGFRAAQMLLTRGDMEERRRYLNARHTLDRLLELGVVPVINENDSTTIEELQFGDNDELSALVAAKMNADLLIILSVIDGLFRRDPAERETKGRRKGEGGEADRAGLAAGEKNTVIAAVETVDETIKAMAGASRSALGLGGMRSKLLAVQLATQAGVHAVIANGKKTGMLERIAGGRFEGTYFAPREGKRLSGRGRWLAYGRKPRGKIEVDAGARKALIEGKKSLLPAGIKGVAGIFSRGDLVEVVGPEGEAIARGLVNYSAAEIEQIKGQRSAQIGKILGHVDYDEVIHRDNLAVME